MTQVSSKTLIHAPADAIWQVISGFGADGQVLSRVVNCTVEGEEVGSGRTLTYADGSTIVARMLALDDAANRFSHVLLTDTPIGNCLTSMKVRDLSPNRADLQQTLLRISGAIQVLEEMLSAESQPSGNGVKPEAQLDPEAA